MVFFRQNCILIKLISTDLITIITQKNNPLIMAYKLNHNVPKIQPEQLKEDYGLKLPKQTMAEIQITTKCKIFWNECKNQYLWIMKIDNKIKIKIS